MRLRGERWVDYWIKRMRDKFDMLRQVNERCNIATTTHVYLPLLLKIVDLIKWVVNDRLACRGMLFIVLQEIFSFFSLGICSVMIRILLAHVFSFSFIYMHMKKEKEESKHRMWYSFFDKKLICFSINLLWTNILCSMLIIGHISFCQVISSGLQWKSNYNGTSHSEQKLFQNLTSIAKHSLSVTFFII